MKIEDIVEGICSQEIENRVINPQLLGILIGGLPGAGKTNLIRKVKKEYANRDFVVIDADNYRILHPNYMELRKNL